MCNTCMQFALQIKTQETCFGARLVRTFQLTIQSCYHFNMDVTKYPQVWTALRHNSFNIDIEGAIKKTKSNWGIPLSFTDPQKLEPEDQT